MARAPNRPQPAGEPVHSSQGGIAALTFVSISALYQESNSQIDARNGTSYDSHGETSPARERAERDIKQEETARFITTGALNTVDLSNRLQSSLQSLIAEYGQEAVRMALAAVETTSAVEPAPPGEGELKLPLPVLSTAQVEAVIARGKERPWKSRRKAKGDYRAMSPVDFLHEVYGEWLGQGLSLALIRRADSPFGQHLANWCKRPGNSYPDGLLTRAEISDSKMRATLASPEKVAAAREARSTINVAYRRLRKLGL